MVIIITVPRQDLQRLDLSINPRQTWEKPIQRTTNTTPWKKNIVVPPDTEQSCQTGYFTGSYALNTFHHP